MCARWNTCGRAPDWDGKTLIVTGASQGGLQSFATAALCPQVTEVLTMVPAGCDACAMLATPPRASSWPGVDFHLDSER